MKTLYLAAALLMATTAAHAGSGISFEIDGQKIHIDAPKNCSSLSCIKITGAGGSAFNLKGFGKSVDDDDVADASPPPPPAPVAAAPAAPVAAAPAAPAPAPVASVAPVAPTAPAAPAPLPERLTATMPVPRPAALPAAAPAPAPVAAAPAPVATPNSPLGVWAAEDDKGNVRIEQCGANLCGYAAKTGERVLINMKPEGSKWSGRIHDPDSGRDYDSTIAMKGSNLLKVQGCAFGGMFCGGQTWKRVS